jgi:hypothetical protein
MFGTSVALDVGLGTRCTERPSSGAAVCLSADSATARSVGQQTNVVKRAATFSSINTNYLFVFLNDRQLDGLVIRNVVECARNLSYVYTCKSREGRASITRLSVGLLCSRRCTAQIRDIY